jgi:hypothetical protein
MHSLRAKPIAAFIIATLMPLGATIWITTSLLERSLGYDDRRTRSAVAHARRNYQEFYQRERDR